MPQPPHNPLEGPRPEMTIPLPDGSEEQVSIVVVHSNTPDYLNICLQSITACSFNNNYELIVVDNGSDQDSLDYLDALEQDATKVIRRTKEEGNLWWSHAANKGAAAASKNSKYIIFMHADTVVLNSGWIDMLINTSESHSTGLVGFELNSYYMHTSRVDFVQEWCVMMTREAWEACGPWAEELPMVGHAFLMSMKAQELGFAPQSLGNGLVHHYNIFSVDVNAYERMAEQALVTIPRLLRDFRENKKK